MSNHKSRLSKLEQRTPKAWPVIRVEIVKITEAHRQAQREAHARGERYYIIEPLKEDDNEQPQEPA
jgi:hypothetical protein